MNDEESNLIKDIKIFQNGYENNAQKSNSTIDNIKKSFQGLSNSVTELIKLIETIRKTYYEQAKQLMKPITSLFLTSCLTSFITSFFISFFSSCLIYFSWLFLIFIFLNFFGTTSIELL